MNTMGNSIKLFRAIYLREVVRMIPLHRLLLETDSPYFAPCPSPAVLPKLMMMEDPQAKYTWPYYILWWQLLCAFVGLSLPSPVMCSKLQLQWLNWRASLSSRFTMKKETWFCSHEIFTCSCLISSWNQVLLANLRNVSEIYKVDLEMNA